MERLTEPLKERRFGRPDWGDAVGESFVNRRPVGEVDHEKVPKAAAAMSAEERVTTVRRLNASAAKRKSCSRSAVRAENGRASRRDSNALV